MPSSLPVLPASPASVVTTPPGLILRMVWLPESATHTVHDKSSWTHAGHSNRAVLPLPPVPSVLPVLPACPASVVTTPAGLILRMVWLPMSATYTLSDESTATPEGKKNRAVL